MKELTGASLKAPRENIFTQDFLDDGYARTFFLAPSAFPWTSGKKDTLDPLLPFDKREIYRGNNYGFRSDDFIKPADLVFAGCSYTYGSGLHEENVWGNILGKLFNMSTANLGLHGASWKIIVDNVIGYCELIGAPKKLACLMPDFWRYTMPVDGTIHRLDDRGYDGTVSSSGNHFSTIAFDKHPDDSSPNLAKKPYETEFVISKDQAIYQSITAIRVLEQYCKTNKINFSWTTWHNGTAKTIDLFAQKSKATDFSNYFSLKPYYGYGYLKRTKKFTGYTQTDDYEAYCSNVHQNKDCSCDNIKNCHGDEAKQYESTGEFHHALDIEHDFASTHPGIHSHLHFVEGFKDNF